MKSGYVLAARSAGVCWRTGSTDTVYPSRPATDHVSLSAENPNSIDQHGYYYDRTITTITIEQVLVCIDALI